MGRIVREQVQVGRVITFGGLLPDSQRILDAAESKEGRFIGINAPRSGAYDNGFRSYIWATVLMKSAGAAKLYEAGVPTVLVGKVADIVSNPYGVSWQNRWIASGLWISPSTNLTPIRRRLFVPISVKPTSLVMQKTSHVMPNVCRSLTVTLPGLLRRCSQMIAVVMADHGNDPTIGHSHHTREVVPVLVYQQGLVATQLGVRTTLSDGGYSV